MKQSRSHDQAKLKIVCDDLCDNIEELLDFLQLEYKNSGKMISMRCPIHGGDNESALNLYYSGDMYRGNWKCRTHQCEHTFKGSIIGFVRGVLSNQRCEWQKDGDDTVSFNDALNFCLKFINKDLKSIKVSNSDRNKQAFTSIINNISTTNCVKNQTKIPRDTARKSLQIPSKYFDNRGFSLEILDKYDIGECINSCKEMYNRAVAPIYDNEYKHIIGCTGRSIFEKCARCSVFHDAMTDCPIESDRWKFPKWKHSADFKSQNHLYNFWFAKEYIRETGLAIIVESPGNVWKLEENNIHNSVAIFGSSLSDRQKICLDSSGAMILLVLTDNDQAGRIAAEKIREKCKNTYKIIIPSISKPDIAEMNSLEIETEIKTIIDNII